MEQISVEYVNVESLIPYTNNARQHGDADTDAIMASIKEFGFNDPIGVWKNIIVEGHGRLIAAKRLGLETVPVIRLDHMTDEQRRAYALAHNRTAELSGWDFNLLGTELKDLADLDMDQFGFDMSAVGDWFEDREKDDRGEQEGNEEYNSFLKKFETKKTTDDCYTPDNIYEAIAGWVAKTFGLNRETFRRPFYPGGNYQTFDYQGGVVVDNPPFSILSEIVDWYTEREIPYWLFAPGVSTLGYTKRPGTTAVCAYADVTYENGANVKTNFLTNLFEDGRLAMTAPDLTQMIEALNRENESQWHRSLPRYEYPPHVLTAAKMGYISYYGQDLVIGKDDAVLIRQMDAQQPADKAIYGAGLLLSERAAAERAAAERAAAERAIEGTADGHRWELSEREWAIIRSLGKRQGDEEEDMEVEDPRSVQDCGDIPAVL